MSTRLDGKVIVVTGSTRGIGRAVAEGLAEAGACIVISSRDKAAVEETIGTMMKTGRKVSGIPCDVSDPKGIERLMDHAVETWGHVDIWVNNAGVGQDYKPLDELGIEDIDRIVDINLKGTAYACRLLIPYFRSRGGMIINMSGKGARGDASPYTGMYAATKAAVTSLTKSLAAENKDAPVSINAVTPGMVETDFYKDLRPSGRAPDASKTVPYVLKAIGVPKEKVAALFVKIAAEQPGRVTGKVYSAMSGPPMMIGIAKLMWYRMTGKIKG